MSAAGHTLDAARWQAIIQAAQDAIICIDETGAVTLFNRAAERLFGYAACEIIGSDVARLMPEPYASEHAGFLRAYRETGVAKAIGRVRNVEAMRRDGSIFPIELSVSEVAHDGSSTYAAIIRDVSERFDIADLLQSEHEFTDSLIETAHVIVLVLDREGRIVRYNRRLEEISGIAFPEMRERDWFTSFIPEYDRPAIRRIFEAALHGNDVEGHVNPILTADGGLRQIQWYAKRLFDRSREVIGVISVGHDITDQLRAGERLRELEDSARQADRLADIGAITAKVVHDLGNPLAALAMQLQLILRRVRRGDVHPAEIVEKPVAQMLETLGRLEALVREFTDFARDRRLKVSRVDLPSYLAEIGALWEAYAAESGVSLRIEAAPGLPALNADPEMFRRVLDNVIKNAIDAITAESGMVVVAAARFERDQVRISVSDDGVGIPDGLDVYRLFETTKPEGTGIGLAVAKQIVDAHGGRIHHEPRTPRGTVFHIDLPVGGPKDR